MDFFVWQMEQHLDAASRRLGMLIGADGEGLIFVDNATYGMNVVATSIESHAGEEVLTTNHEYDAVLRIWRRACKRSGAKLVVRRLPEPIVSAEEIVESFMRGVTNRTRLIVVSHIRSPTALILPVEGICLLARALGVSVCIDGPHAPAMIPVNLRTLNYDFYTASCHKWLCAPFGTGFLYVSRRHRRNLKSPVVSWGRSLGGRSGNWKDEFNWEGTRDPVAFLAVPAAIDILESAGFDEFRTRTHKLARYARGRLTEYSGLDAIAPDRKEWYGSMITLPIAAANDGPPKHGRSDPLQDALWEQFRIEVPVIHWRGRRFVRISCHLYNDRHDIDRLVEALNRLLG